jgi:hypothetical protein
MKTLISDGMLRSAERISTNSESSAVKDPSLLLPEGCERPGLGGEGGG